LLITETVMEFNRINPITGEVASSAPALKAGDVGAIAARAAAVAQQFVYLQWIISCELIAIGSFHRGVDAARTVVSR